MGKRSHKLVGSPSKAPRCIVSKGTYTLLVRLANHLLPTLSRLCTELQLLVDDGVAEVTFDKVNFLESTTGPNAGGWELVIRVLVCKIRVNF